MVKITIDPGHGGKDKANQGPTGYVEADGTLKLSLYLESELLKYGAFTVQLTRRGDETVSLTKRGQLAADFKSDLFLSEHTNAANKRVRGTTVFYSVDLPVDKELAEKLSAAVSGALNIPNRGAKTRASLINPNEDYYTVIDTAQDGGVPHVILIENAFHDNPEDERLLLSDILLQKVAKAQAGVIREWFNVAENSDTGTGTDTIDDTGMESNDGDDDSVTGVGTGPDASLLPVLKLRSVGDGVKILQFTLNKLGYDSGEIDSIFGIKTLEAVKKFQMKNGLVVDGIVGSNTWEVLLSVRSNEVPL